MKSVTESPTEAGTTPRTSLNRCSRNRVPLMESWVSHRCLALLASSCITCQPCPSCYCTSTQSTTAMQSQANLYAQSAYKPFLRCLRRFAKDMEPGLLAQCMLMHSKSCLHSAYKTFLRLWDCLPAGVLFWLAHLMHAHALWRNTSSSPYTLYS